MADLSALEQFKESLKMSEELMKLERENYKNPPHTSEQKAVEGLRGGAIVLMVAAWESFLKQLMEDELAPLAIHPPKVKFCDLPKEMQIHSVFQSLDRATKGSRFQKSEKFDRLTDIDRAAKNIVLGLIDPRSFSDIDSNPNPKIVKRMFLNIGIDNIFSAIRNDFEKEWHHPASEKFIEDKLAGILNRRHHVAHKADILNVSRKDLKDEVRFMKILATVVEKRTKLHIKDMIVKST